MSTKRKHEKLKKEEREMADVFQDFLRTFQNTSNVGKTFIRSGTLNGDELNERSQFYVPKPLIKHDDSQELARAVEYARILNPVKENKKKKSNLQELSEELKMRHEKVKRFSTLGSYLNSSEQISTNLFLTNIKSNLTENDLMKHFGQYGPLASVKIMHPRCDDKFRRSICGFVAFMSRKDAERAYKLNQNWNDIKIDWGKAVEIPQHPVYIPQCLLAQYLPPPVTNLPFNAQHIDGSLNLKNCIVKVVIPLDKRVLNLVNRTVEFVIREGPLFEAFIMNKEIDNPDYNFLFDNKSPVHIYYRWKIFSILNGDSQKHWKQTPFRMFKNGSIWIPPIPQNFTSGMPDELIEEECKLTDVECKELVKLIRDLTMDRWDVGRVMRYCLNHNNAVNDCVDVVVDSLLNDDTFVFKKIARLYLLFDITANCKAKNIKLKIIKDENKIFNIFKSLQTQYCKLSVLDKEEFRSRIIKVLFCWEKNKIFPRATLDQLRNLVETKGKEEDDEVLDEPLDGASLLKNYERRSKDYDMSEYFVPSKWDEVDPEEIQSQAMSVQKLYEIEEQEKNLI